MQTCKVRRDRGAHDRLRENHRHRQGKGRRRGNQSVVMMLAANALAAFKAEFLRVMGDCVAVQQEQDTAEADEGADVPPPVY
jgi:hypothetical protein